MPINPIVNGSFDGTIDGWTFEGPSVASIADTDAYEGLYCALISYNKECAIVRGTRINQTITIPNVDGDIFIEFWERTSLAYWAGSCGIKINGSWIWRIGYGTAGRRSATTNWTKQSVNVNDYKGQTVQLAITWHDPSATYCAYGDHIGWIRVDDIRLVLPIPIETLFRVDISSNPPLATIEVDGQVI